MLSIREILEGAYSAISGALKVALRVGTTDVDAAHPLPVDIKNAAIEITTTVSDIVTVEQSDKTKLKTTTELSAGTALIGKVSIDQTTPNANEVVIKTINAGSNLIGKIGIDQTTDGTTNKVNAQNATHDNLNANANIQQNNADVASGNPLYTTLEDGKDVTFGSKADAKSDKTDTTAVTAMQVLKQISYMEQNPASRAVTIADGGDVTIGAKADAKSTATDTTAITIMSVLKQISYMLQTYIFTASNKYDSPGVPTTRPNNATPYSIGDVVGTDVATNMEFTGIANANKIRITNLKMRIDVSAIPTGMSAFRLHLYTSAPTAITDNLAFNLPSADRAKYVGYIDIDTPIDIGDTLWVQMDNVNFECTATGTSLFGQLQTMTAYTPTAQAVKTIWLKSVEI